LGGCSDDELPAPYDFRLDTQCQDSTPNSGVYHWADSGSTACRGWLLKETDCGGSQSQREPDVVNPDVSGMSGGVEGDEWVVRVYLVDQQGPPCAFSMSRRSDVCDRGGVSCNVSLTPI
jgi:hypothetical protein